MPRWTIDDVSLAVAEFAREVGPVRRLAYVVIVGDFAKMILENGPPPPLGVIDAYAPLAPADLTVRMNGLTVQSVQVRTAEDRKKLITESRKVNGVRAFVGEVKYYSIHLSDDG